MAAFDEIINSHKDITDKHVQELVSSTFMDLCIDTVEETQKVSTTNFDGLAEIEINWGHGHFKRGGRPTRMYLEVWSLWERARHGIIP